MLKTRTLYCGGVCGREGAIKTLYNFPRIYHDPAIGYSISLVCWCWRVGVGQWLHVQMHFTLITCVGTCMRLITMEMIPDIK